MSEVTQKQEPLRMAAEAQLAHTPKLKQKQKKGRNRRG